MDKYKKKYLVAFASSMAYSYWLIGSGLTVFFVSKKYIYFSLFFIMLFSFIVSLIIFKGFKKISIYGVFSGMVVAIGNTLLYILIGNVNVVIAGSFTALNLVFFPLLIFKGDKKNLVKHLAGSSIVALGLIIESLTLSNFKMNFIFISILIGIFLGLLYALSTYFLNISLIKEKDVENTISTIFLTETLFFGLATLLFKNFYFEIFSNILFIINTLLISITIFIGIYLESKGFKGLKASEYEERNIINILSNLELMPIIIISIFEYTEYMPFYITGLFLIILGMIVITIK